MSRMPSGTLTSPQYYHLGWTRDDEVRVITRKELEKGPVIAKIKKLNSSSEGISTVIYVPQEGGKCGFISCPQSIEGLALHLSSGGSSQLVKKFGKEYYDNHFTGLEITTLENIDDVRTISIELKSFSMKNSFEDFDDIEDNFLEFSDGLDDVDGNQIIEEVWDNGEEE